MNNNPTRAASMADLRDAVGLLREYTIHFPELPIPYISLSRYGDEITLGVDLECFEAWREALGMSATLVKLYPVHGTGSHLSVQSVVSMGISAEARRVEVSVQLYARGLPCIEERPAGEMPQARQTEDPHDSPLHHAYATSRDLPGTSARGVR